jgi:RNase P subunit RPR2
MVFCPNCGHPQKVMFAFNEIQVLATCEKCGKAARFQMTPSGADRWLVKR